MNLEPAPRLNKTPFIAVAAVCSLAVLLIGIFAEDKFAAIPFLSAVALLGVSIIAVMLPVLVDYAADNAEYVQSERVKVAEQAQRIHAVGESLLRAAAQIKAVEEAAQKTAHAAEHLPYRMQEKLSEFTQQLAEVDQSERDRLTAELNELRQRPSAVAAPAQPVPAPTIDLAPIQALSLQIQQATAAWAQTEQQSRQQIEQAQAAALEKFDARATEVMHSLDEVLTNFATLLASVQLSGAAAPAETTAASPDLEPAQPLETAHVPDPSVQAEQPAITAPAAELATPTTAEPSAPANAAEEVIEEDDESANEEDEVSDALEIETEELETESEELETETEDEDLETEGDASEETDAEDTEEAEAEAEGDETEDEQIDEVEDGDENSDEEDDADLIEQADEEASDELSAEDGLSDDTEDAESEGDEAVEETSDEDEELEAEEETEQPAAAEPVTAVVPPVASSPVKTSAPSRNPKSAELLPGLADEDAKTDDDLLNRTPKPAKATAPITPTTEGELFAADSFHDEVERSAEPAPQVEAAASSDGATRLLATAYIGIGNKLFIRGDGPGLSWEKGVPMQFVSIGKWGWASHDATAPIRAKLYKNDDIAALSGEILLPPGKHVEITAEF